MVARLSASGHDPGVDDLTRSLKTLAAAQRASDPMAVHAALIDVAAAALNWAGAVST